MPKNLHSSDIQSTVACDIFGKKIFFFFGTRLLHIALRIGNCKFACNFEISSFYSHQLHKEVFLSCLGDLCWRDKKSHSLFFNVINNISCIQVFISLEKKKKTHPGETLWKLTYITRKCCIQWTLMLMIL